MKARYGLAVLTAVMVLTAALCIGFSSEQTYRPGMQDRFRGYFVTADTCTAGQVVSLSYSYNAYTTEAEYDTGTWVVLSTDENDSYVVGIVDQNGLPLDMVRVIKCGQVMAKIDGSDSGGATMTPGTVLSVADRDGYLGATKSDSTGNADSASVGWNCSLVTEYVYRTMPVAVLYAPTVAATDTGALTTYSVYVSVR